MTSQRYQLRTCMTRRTVHFSTFERLWKTMKPKRNGFDPHPREIYTIYITNMQQVVIKKEKKNMTVILLIMLNNRNKKRGQNTKRTPDTYVIIRYDYIWRFYFFMVGKITVRPLITTHTINVTSSWHRIS